MGLVDYGSDSEEESTTPAILPPPPAPKPTKRKKGPVRILLDLPKVVAPVEPPKKKPKFTLGSGAVNGLSAMLPPPKHESTKVKLEKVFGEGESVTEVFTKPSTPGFIPHTIAKGKKAAEVAVSVDFFGLGTSSAQASTSTLPSAPKQTMSISSAPSIISSSFGAPATAKDPHPGFVKNEQGTWVAKDQETYELYLASVQKEELANRMEAAPKGFDVNEMNSSGMLEVDAGQRMRDKRPEHAPRPGSEAYELAKPKIAQLPKTGSKGKAKAQLSSLLSDAVANRADLEERIAQGKANRKSAGNKYGF